jgi:hypothetical protein
MRSQADSKVSSTLPTFLGRCAKVRKSPLAHVDLFVIPDEPSLSVDISLAEFSIAGMLPAMLQDADQAVHTVGPALLAQMEEYARPARVYTRFTRQISRSRIFQLIMLSSSTDTPPSGLTYATDGFAPLCAPVRIVSAIQE